MWALVSEVLAKFSPICGSAASLEESGCILLKYQLVLLKQDEKVNVVLKQIGIVLYTSTTSRLDL